MNNIRFGYINLLITVLLFSTFETASKLIGSEFSALEINFLRFLIGGMLLLVILIVKKEAVASLKELGSFAMLGLLNVVLSMSILQYCLTLPNSKASVIAVIFSSNPIFVAIFASKIDGEKLGINKLFGFLLGIVGILVIMFQKFGTGSMDIVSPLLALLSAILYGLYSVLGRKISLNSGSLKMNTYSFIFGSLLLVPFLIVSGVKPRAIPVNSILILLYLAIFVTGTAYICYFVGLKIAGASSGSMVFFLKPVFASIISIILLGEVLTINLVIGAILVVLGLVIVLYGEKFTKIFVVKDKR